MTSRPLLQLPNLNIVESNANYYLCIYHLTAINAIKHAKTLIET